jgi:predicted GH43/DUF377 family glycosyl hydrolase
MNRILLLVLYFSVLAIVPVIGRDNGKKDWAWTGFHRPDSVNPIISPDTNSVFYCRMRKHSVAWEESDTFNPAATVINGKVVVLYRAEDNSATGIGSRTSRIGYASSDDGIHFVRHGAPVLFPDSDSQSTYEVPGGCEDPRVAMTEDGLYVMMYTEWNHRLPRLAVATSRDLVNWIKYGPVFSQAYNGRFMNVATKSASIITCMKNGKLIIAKLNGKYYMYWGEQFVNLATSEDLINWTPMLDGQGNLLKVMAPRKGYFDSMLTECGPPAIMTPKGIILFYNGKNQAGEDGDLQYTENIYCAGEALFSINDPAKLIDRLNDPFFYPQSSFEKSGQYPAGTVFIEGLVPFKNKWYLYYGCADSRVGVAVRDEAR